LRFLPQLIINVLVAILESGFSGVAYVFTFAASSNESLNLNFAFNAE
jgi:hypothetical protein